MVKTVKKTGAILFSLLFTAILISASFTAPVSAKKAHISAKDSGKSGVHADISTFEKNFSLSVAQKKYAIVKIDRIVSILLDPDMSDLEKYYRLALWENDHVTYDYDFWSGGYNFQYYRHQWDAYGALTDTSVCAGIAILYANLCHAADLPCKFVRTDPKLLDHTINYIPDINGNAYYIDVTEASFFMSEKADGSFGDMIDKDFAYINKYCTDGSFEYKYIINTLEGDYTAIVPSNIKECFKKPFSEWYKEYARHEGTTKEFLSDYVEKGSGTRGVHYAHYHDYPKQFSATEKPGIWFLEDFYKNPEDIKAKILAKKFDEQLINIVGLEDSYDCDNSTDLVNAVMSKMEVGYFPSLVNGEILPQEDELIESSDFKLTCKSFDKAKGQAVLVMTAMGDYNGTCEFAVKLKSDAATKADNPMKLKGKTAAVNYKKLRKKPQIIKRAKAFSVSNAEGKLVYKYVTAKKGKKNFKKYFKVSAKTGKVKVRKGLKKGTYKVKVKVKAAGNEAYKASPWKSVVFKVKVK